MEPALITASAPATAAPAARHRAPARDARPVQIPLDFDSQGENLERVSHRIRTAICQFARSSVDRQFHMEDLRRHITGTVGHVAPGSPDRVLRDLRKRGLITYTVVSRSQSLYRITEVTNAS